MPVLLTLFTCLSSLCFGQFTDSLKKCENKTAVRTIDGVDYLYLINLDHRKEKLEKSLKEFAPYKILPYRFSAVNGKKLPIQTLWNVGLVFEKGMRPGGLGTVYKWAGRKEYQSHEIIQVPGTQYFAHCTSRGQIGCLLSHLAILHDALQSEYEIIWICEDDIKIVRDPHVLSNYIKELDTILGRDGWDILYTASDYYGPQGQVFKACGGNYRPNIETRNQASYNVEKSISKNLKQIGPRFGTQSMIWTKRGMRKVLDFYAKYKVFLPIDLDLCLIPGLKMYAVTSDVVNNDLNSESDISIEKPKVKTEKQDLKKSGLFPHFDPRSISSFASYLPYNPQVLVVKPQPKAFVQEFKARYECSSILYDHVPTHVGKIDVFYLDCSELELALLQSKKDLVKNAIIVVTKTGHNFSTLNKFMESCDFVLYSHHCKNQFGNALYVKNKYYRAHYRSREM